MRDGPGRRFIKAITRTIYLTHLRVTRAFHQHSEPPRYRLEGECSSCGKCCENPSIQVGPFLWHMPITRQVFLYWQFAVNGFVLIKAEREDRVFTFVCTHFDPETRQCDSYDSRPGICRDYPFGLVHQPWPEFFEECSYRPIVIDESGARLREVLANAELTDEQREKLNDKLFL